MDKLEYLLKFRRSNNDETLEKVVEHMEPKISNKVPKSAWKFVK